MRLRRMLRSILLKLGLDVRFTQAPEVRELGADPLSDAAKHMSTEAPVVFDVGANNGGTVKQLCSLWPRATIHSFEPSPRTFSELKHNVAGAANVKLNQLAMGSRPGGATLIENQVSVLSSLLPPDPEWGEWQVSSTDTRIATIDEYCSAHDVDRIDLLKTDTQGYDLEVLRGASGMLDENRVGLVLTELTFLPMYLGQPRYCDVLSYLHDRGFCVVSLYNFYYRGNCLEWCDALLANPEYPSEKKL